MVGLVALALLFPATIMAQANARAAFPSDVQRYVRVNSPELKLINVRIIDGLKPEALENRTLVIEQRKISWIGAADQVPSEHQDAPELDLEGYSVMPGIIGMHDHLFYAAMLDYDEHFKLPAPGPLMNEIAFSAPRLYLAAGVTALRTTGSMEPYTDINVKAQIDAGLMVGPDLDVTAPYLQGRGGSFPQMHSLRGPEDVRRMVSFWADQGATSFKAYTHMTRAELAAAVEESHRHKLRITGHLCAVSYREAAALGIDNLEHGPVYSDTGFVADRAPDECPSSGAIAASWLARDVRSPEVQELIRYLVGRKVAVTSTLPVFELKLPGRPPLPQRAFEVMSPHARESYLLLRARLPASAPDAVALFKKEMEFEVAFARAGGLLLAGPDPTGIGGVLPGFGNHRAIELLVEAGFSEFEAIGIATANGARYLGKLDEMGTVSVGKRANLVVVKGDPSRRIGDIESVEIVFKDGVGYDSRRLIDSVRGTVGIR